jgi:hypothetical protein
VGNITLYQIANAARSQGQPLRPSTDPPLSNYTTESLILPSRETLIKYLATANAADLPHSFGKNARNTASIPAPFACTMHQSHQRSQ